MTKKFILLILLISCLVYSQDRDLGKVKLYNSVLFADEETPYYKHKVDKVEYFSRIHPDNMKFKIETNGQYVDFEIKDNVNKTMELYYNENGIKELTIISSGNSGDDSLEYTVDTNLPFWSVVGNQILYQDAEKNVLFITPEITANYWNGVDSTNVLQSFYKVDNKLVVKFDGSLGYPVIIDPSITFGGSAGANTAGYFSAEAGSWQNGRDAAAATSANTAHDHWWGYLHAGTKVWRPVWAMSVHHFEADTVGFTRVVDSIVVKFNGVTEAGTYKMAWFGANITTTIGVGDYDNFLGHAGAGAYSAVRYTEWFEDTDYAAGLNNYMKFTQTGIDSFLANSSSSGDKILSIIGMSENNHDDTDPTPNDTYLALGSVTGGGVVPIITLYYTDTPITEGDILTKPEGTPIHNARGKEPTNKLNKRQKFIIFPFKKG